MQPPVSGRSGTKENLARKIVEERAEQTVEARRARDAQPFSWRVRPLDLGAYGDHLDPGEPLADDCTLEPAVHDREPRLDAEHPLERVARDLEEPGLPDG